MKKGLSILLSLALLFSLAVPFNASAQTKQPGDNAAWAKIQEIIGSFADKNVWTDTKYSGAITNKMPHTAILGNGNVGVTSYGSATEKTYLLSSTDFWSDSAGSFGYSGRSPQIITGGGLTVSPADRGYGNDGTAADASFREQMDIAKAEIRTTMNLGSAPVDIVNWLSAEKNIMVTQITSQSDGNQSLSISAWGKDDLAVLPTDSGVIEENGRKMVWATRKSNTENAKWMSEFAIASTVLGGEQAEYSAEGNKGVILVDVPAGETVTVVTAIKCEGNQKNVNAPDGADGLAVQGAKALLGAVNDSAGVEALHQSHLDWWKNFYLLSWLDMGDVDLNRTYYGSQYIFGSGTRENSAAPGLYSVWITTNNAAWQGDYHLNYNFQAPYYASYSSNRLKEFSQSMFDVFLNFIDSGVEWASNPSNLRAITAGGNQAWYYSTREDEDAFKNGFEDALLFPVGLTPNLVTSEGNDRYLNQTINALISASQICSYYNYTLDDEWLMTPQLTASGSSYSPYDFLAKTANFYVQWVEKRASRVDNEYVKDSKSREYPDKQVYPTDYTANYAKYPEYDESVHGDNYTYVLFDGAHEGSFEFNPNVTVGNVQYLMDTLVAIGGQKAESYNSGHYTKWYPQWADIAGHLVGTEGSAYVYERDTANKGKTIFGLSEDRKVRLISATVNLEMIHPGYQFSFNSDPEQLEIARNTVSVMGDDGKALGYGWRRDNCDPKIYTHAARVGYDTNSLINRLKANAVARMKPNNYINDNTHGWEKVGIVEALNTMMVMSDGEIIKVFPNWNNTSAEFHTVRMPGAFLVSSETKAGSVQHVEVESEKGGELKLVIPWDTALYDTTLVDTDTGLPVEFTTAVTENSKDPYLTVSTKAGGRYSLVKGYPKIGLPESPVNLEIEEIQPGSITLKWEANPNEGENPTYEVRYAAQGGEAKKAETQETAITLENLQPGTAYSIQVYARYSSEQYSEGCAALTIATPPATGTDTVILNVKNAEAVRGQKVGVSRDELAAAMPQTVDALVYHGAGGSSEIISLNVTWELSGVNLNSTAVQTVPGTIVLADGVVNPQALDVFTTVRLHDNSISYTKENMTLNQMLNLTELGTVDWVHLAANGAEALGLERKNTDDKKISDITFTSGSTGSYGPIAGASDWAIRNKWSDGSPTKTYENVEATNKIGSGEMAGLRYVGNCFEFTVEGQPFEQELILSLGAWQSVSRLTVTFADGNEVGITDTVDSHVDKISGGMATAHYNNKGAKLFRIKFKATEPGEKMVVRYGAETSYAANEQAMLQAVMLSGTPTLAVDSGIENGTVAVNPTAPKQGDKVNVTVTPTEGYRLKKGSLNYDGTPIKKDGEGNYSFTMPYAAVVVSAQFEPAPDKEALTALIAKFDNEALYTPASWAEFAPILQGAKDALADEGSTQGKLNTAYTELLAASLELVERPNKSGLKALIDEAEALDTGNCRPGKVKDFEKALADAQKTYGDPNADLTAINAATDTLLEAMLNLKDIVDRTELNKLVAILEKLDETQYFKAGFDKLKEAIAQAKLLDDDASVKQVEDAYKALQKAYGALVRLPDKTALANAVKNAETILKNRGDYMPSTIAGLEELVQKAKAVLNKPEATKEEIATALNSLTQALAKVRVKEDRTALLNAIDRANKLEAEKYTVESYAFMKGVAAKAVLTAENGDATKVEIEKALADLNGAMDNLVLLKDDNNGGDGTTDVPKTGVPFSGGALALTAVSLAVLAIDKRRRKA